MVLNTLQELSELLKDTVETGQQIKVKDMDRFRKEIIDTLVWTAVFSPDETVRMEAKRVIWDTAIMAGIMPSSIHELYMAMGRGQTGDFTVPAMNIRCMTYDVARRVFRVAKELRAGAFIFEIAKSEMQYTDQPPQQYSIAVIAAAIKEGFKGPVFIQGDHFQISRESFLDSPEREIQKLKDLISHSIRAGFYNIDIDASTIVDYSRQNVSEQQALNYRVTAELTAYIREIEPEGITVSVGAEIGHIGGKNSTVAEAEAFMEGFLKELNSINPAAAGLSKLSVQTGTTHGGIPLPDGRVATVKVDFNVLKDIGMLVRQRYGLSGTVQHGASTLPEEMFDLFPEHCCSEIHLATGFQNIMYEFAPEDLRAEIYEYLKATYRDQWDSSMTEEQFLYKIRKKAFGPFKRQWWGLSEGDKTRILDALQQRIKLLFRKLKIDNTAHILADFVKMKPVGFHPLPDTPVTDGHIPEDAD